VINVVEGLKNLEDMIKNKIKEDSVLALKNHDNRRVDVLRYLISLIDKRELQLPVGEMNDGEEMKVLQKELKNKEESKEMFLKGNRDDLALQLDYEISILKDYLPQAMSEDEVAKLVDESIKNNGNNFGVIMKDVMNKLNGQVGGDLVSKLVKQKISGSN
jgi:uncharacterized protein